MSLATQMTKKERGRFLGGMARRTRDAEVCEYGHFDCSNREHGPCLNEAAGLREAEHRQIATAERTAR